MGLFGRGPKFSEMQTEEERYRASTQRQQAESAAAPRRTEAHNNSVGRAATQRSASKPQIKKVGTLRKVGRNKWKTDGWEIDVPGGEPGRVVEENVEHRGSLHGLTIRDLCRAAHGARCNCARR